jgi:hypothetical protein
MKKSPMVETPSLGKVKHSLALPFDFSIKQVLSEAWTRVHGTKAVYWKGMLFYLFILVGLFAIGAIFNYFLMQSTSTAPGVSRHFMQLWQAVCYLIIAPMTVGFAYIGIRRSVNLAITSKQIFYPYEHYLKVISTLLLVIIILYGILFAGFFMIAVIQNLYYSANGAIPTWLGVSSMAAGLIFVLIMYYFSLAFLFAPLLVVEKNFTVLQAMKASFFAFNQHWFKIIVAHSFMLFIYVLSAIPLGIGMIWAIPMLINFVGLLYRIIFGVEEAR